MYGEGTPIYILHGLFGMLDNWHSFAKQLSKDYLIVAVDLRNHGRSFHDDDVSYTAMSEDVIQLMDHLQHDEVFVLGHSMGGKTACSLTLNHPHRVKGLIVVDILPIEYERGHDQVLLALANSNPQSTESRADIKQSLMNDLNGDVSTANFLLKSLKREDSGGFSWKFNLSALSTNYDRIREQPPGKNNFLGATLFIKGGLSQYIGMDGWHDTTEMFPNADLEEVEGAGHWIHADKPDELMTVVKGFIQKNDIAS